MGVSFLTFDWTEISWITSPLMVPWWAQVQVFTGFVIFYWIMTPALYYTNVNIFITVSRHYRPLTRVHADLEPLIFPDVLLVALRQVWEGVQRVHGAYGREEIQCDGVR